MNGIQTIYKSYGVDCIKGSAKFLDNKNIEVVSDESKETLSFAQAIIATGSCCVSSIPGITVDGKRIINSDLLLDMDTLPESMLIIGGGVIGLEFATVFSTLGVKVAVVEMLPDILPGEDKEISGLLKRALESRGIEIKTGEKLTAIPESYEKVLIAVGRRPFMDGLGLESAGINTERGRVVVDKKMQTNVSGIYAAGDITGGKLLAYKASAEGIIAAENAVKNEGREIDYNAIPSCIFTEPEVASVGMSDSEAKAQGYSVRVGKFPFAASGKAIVMNKPKGLVKMVVDEKTNAILGLQIMGPHATELISQAAVLIGLGAKAGDLQRKMFGHPTISEAIYCAAESIEGKVIDLPKNMKV